LWIQAAIAAAAPSSSGEALASVQLMLPSDDCLLGSSTFEVNPDVNAGEFDVYQIGGTYPAFGLTRLMVAVIFSGWVSGNVVYQPVVRYFNREPDAGPWATIATSRTTASNDRFNFLESTLSPGLNLWLQVGLKVSTATRGNFKVLAAGKY
jgi:hypothetical protein